MVTMIETTERKAVEKNLQESEERYRSLVESALEAIFSIDHHGKYLFMNRVSAERLSGSGV